MYASFAHDVSIHRFAQVAVSNAPMEVDPRPRILQLMEKQGLSQRRLAEIGSIDQSALSRYLSNKSHDIQLGTLVGIAEALGVTLSYLVGEHEITQDPKILRVVKAMETMPEYKKDAVVAASSALTEQTGRGIAA